MAHKKTFKTDRPVNSAAISPTKPHVSNVISFSNLFPVRCFLLFPVGVSRLPGIQVDSGVEIHLFVLK